MKKLKHVLCESIAFLAWKTDRIEECEFMRYLKQCRFHQKFLLNISFLIYSAQESPLRLAPAHSEALY